MRLLVVASGWLVAAQALVIRQNEEVRAHGPPLVDSEAVTREDVLMGAASPPRQGATEGPGVALANGDWPPPSQATPGPANGEWPPPSQALASEMMVGNGQQQNLADAAPLRSDVQQKQPSPEQWQQYEAMQAQMEQLARQQQAFQLKTQAQLFAQQEQMQSPVDPYSAHDAWAKIPRGLPGNAIGLPSSVAQLSGREVATHGSRLLATSGPDPVSGSPAEMPLGLASAPTLGDQYPPEPAAALMAKPPGQQQLHDALLSTAARAASANFGAAPKTVTGNLAKPKGWDQCMHFARFMKEKEVTGREMVQTWQATCMPAVRSGRASERYRLMCNSLAGAVEPFASEVDYNIESMCDTVLAVFHDLTAGDTT